MSENTLVFDGHIHTHGKPSDPPEVFAEKAREAGVAGGTVFSVHPAKYRPFPGWDQRAKARIDAVLEFTSRAPGFLPYFFADLSEPDVLDQIDYARKGGIRGFKVICDGAYAAGDRLEALAAMAETGLPVMFHSGVDNIPHISGANNRPAAFERLLDVRGLRFSLAHLGWPWCDEFIGTFAKFVFAGEMDGPGRHADMYVDVTPGTPGLYRREAMRKLYLSGFDVRPRTFWGSDQVCNDYYPDWSRRMIARDAAILAEIERDAATGAVGDVCWDPRPRCKDLSPALFADVWREFNREP